MPWPKGKSQSEEHRKKNSQALKGKSKQPFSAGHRKKISEALTGRTVWFKGKTVLEICGGDEKKAALRLAQTRAASKLGSDKTRGTSFKMSEESVEKFRQSILSGKANPHRNRWKEKFKVDSVKAGTVFCQSSWEVTLCHYLDAHPLVTFFSKDKVRIRYLYQGKPRIYIVDFLVSYVDGSKELVEVKPFDMLDKYENPSKFEAARRWCIDNNSDFVLITEKEIQYIR